MFRLTFKFGAALLIIGGLHLAFGFNKTIETSMKKLVDSFRDVMGNGDSCFGILPMVPYDAGDFELPIKDRLNIITGNASYRSVTGFNLTTWDYFSPEISLLRVRYEPEIIRMKIELRFVLSFVQGRYEGVGKSLKMFNLSEKGTFHISCMSLWLHKGKGLLKIKKSGIRLRELAFDEVIPYLVTPFFSGLTAYNRMGDTMGFNIFDTFSEKFSKEFTANLRTFVNLKLKGVSLDDLAAGKFNSNCTNK